MYMKIVYTASILE